MIQWYKQSLGENEMILLGYARFTFTAVEDAFENIYKVTGEGSRLSTFHIPKLRESVDSAMYFCAAQCCIYYPSSTKTSSNADSSSYSGEHQINHISVTAQTAVML